MPYSIEWYIPDRLIYITVTGKITVADLKALDDTMWTMIESGRPPVHVLTDVTELEYVPGRLVDLRDLYYRLDTSAMGWNLVVTENRTVRLISSVIGRFRRIRLRTFKTRRAALAFLQNQDSSLPKLLANSNP
jgi:hypothetical protein